MTNKNTVKTKVGSEDDINSNFPNLKILNIEGTDYKTLYTRKYDNNAEWKMPNPKELKSFIPGTITNVYIKNGQKVKHGDKLLVLEAMKMLNQIIAPFDGIIKEVNVKAGDKVTKGFKMVEFK